MNDSTNYVASDTFEYNGKTIEFKYFTRFNMSNRIAFIDAVVESIVGDNYYYPMLKDMMFDYQLMLRFSDVVMSEYVGDTTDMKTGVFIDTIEKFLDETNIGTIMRLGIDVDELSILMDGVDSAIEYKTGIHPSPIADAVASLLDTVEQKFAGVDMNSMNGMAKVFSKMNGDITPEKMLDAYANSDVFKRMHDETVKKQSERDSKMDEIRKDVDDNVVVDGNVLTMKDKVTV